MMSILIGVKAVEEKLRETRRKIYGNLTACSACKSHGIRSGHVAMDYVERCLQTGLSCMEIARFAEDRAMPCGLATLGTQRCVVITHQKGRNTKKM